MATSLAEEILGVRSVLGEPLDNAPSAEEITEALEEVYQHVTNLTNNTGNAWQVASFTIEVTPGTRAYQIDPVEVDDFYKALLVTTVPSDVNAYPEYVLEFAELEHLPQEWGWLSQNNGSLFYSSHSSHYVAFYREIGSSREAIWMELRPTPSKVESYKVLYQIGDWWDKITATTYGLPHKEYRFHLRRLAALGLIERQKVRWSYDKKANADKEAQMEARLLRAIERGASTFEAHIASLDQADVTRLQSYADDLYLIQ